MKITRRGRADERTFAVLVIIPARDVGQLMANIDAQVRHRLLVLVLQRSQRLQNVELRHVAVNAGDAVARFVGLKRMVVIPKFVWLV